MFGLFKRKKKVFDSGAELASTGLKNISDAIDNDLIELEQGRLFDDIYCHFDNPNGTVRVSYVMFSPSVQNEVIARCAIILDRHFNEVGVWTIDWAVRTEYRGQGFGRTIATKAIQEFTNGMKAHMSNGIYLEAIVSVTNISSNKIASRLLGNAETITNSKTQEVVNNYLLKFDKGLV